MKRKILLILFLSVTLFIDGQTNSVIEKMRRERAEMEDQIASQEKILVSTESDISSQVKNLDIITARLKERTRMLEKTRSEIRSQFFGAFELKEDAASAPEEASE